MECLSFIEKTNFASNTSGSLAVKLGPRLRCSNRTKTKKSFPSPPRGAWRSPLSSAFRPNVFPLHDVRYRRDKPKLEPYLTFNPDPPRSLNFSGNPRSNETDFHRNRPPRWDGRQWLKEERNSITIEPDTSGVWWSQTGSNRRPHACKARALPTELWPLLCEEKDLAKARRRGRA